MPSTSVAVQMDKPAQAPAKTPKETKTLRITAKVRAAVDAMVWEGLKRDDAANKAGMKDNSLYVALTRPDVKAYYNQQCEVLRTSGRARRIHRLEAMLEQNDNKAAVINAALALEGMANDQAAANAQVSAVPGVIIQIVTQAPVQHVQTIDHERHATITTT
jgi:hypothetical protein